MNASPNYPIIDFNPAAVKGKKILYFKRPKGYPIPVGIPWRCLCGRENIISELPEQYCGSCGNKLRLQENKEDYSKYFSFIVLSHITVKN